MNISDNGLALIAEFEGFGARLYNDPVGHCTVGYGHLLHRGNCDGRANEVPYQSGITKAQALKLLGDDVVSRVAAVNDAVTVPLNQNQFDALVSFVFNVGAGTFREATFLGKLNAGHYDAVPDGLALYNKARGADGVLRVLPGLVRRRKAEADLWNTPVDVPAPEEEEDDMRNPLVLLHAEGSGAYYLSDWMAKRHITMPELTMFRYVRVPEAEVPADILDAIPEVEP